MVDRTVYHCSDDISGPGYISEFYIMYSHTKIYLSIYLSIRLNPRRGNKTGSGEPIAGVIHFILFYLMCSVSSVSSE